MGKVDWVMVVSEMITEEHTVYVDDFGVPEIRTFVITN